MPKGYAIPDDEKQKIYTSHCLGESNADIADRLDLSVVTVRRIVREQRKKYEKERSDMARSGKIVKKDGRGGKLMALPVNGFEFTHVTPDGKSHKKKVDGHYSRVAESQYDAWCQQLDDECEFMRKVERRDEYESVEPEKEEAFVVDETPESVPDMEMRPWREVAEERQQEIDRLNVRIVELEATLREKRGLDDVIAKTELETPKLSSWFNSNGSFKVIQADRPAYVLWAKTDSPRLYGAYSTMEDALKEVDRLNEVAAFLGNGSAFEVEEVAWRR